MILFLLVIGRLFFRVRSVHLPGLALVIVCAALCFVGLMMFFATLGETEEAVAGAASAGMIVMAMIGGGMIPLIAMPGWMRTVSNASPVKWAVYGMEGAIWRGFTLADMLLPRAILVGVGLVACAAGVKLFARAAA